MDQKKLEQVRKDTEEVQKMLMGENLKFTVEWHKYPAEIPPKGRYLTCSKNGTVNIFTFHEDRQYWELGNQSIILWAKIPIPPKAILQARNEAKIKKIQEQIKELEDKLQKLT